MADSHTIKICGISTPETAIAVAQSRATAIGFMLAASRRQVSPAGIRRIRDEASLQRLAIVGVVVNEPANVIQSLVDDGLVDIVQLSGDESPDLLDTLPVPVWKALRFPSGTPLDRARNEIDSWLDRAQPADRILVDASVAGAYGGTGHTADWDLVAALAERYPVILAGGLTPGNVDVAIAHVQPAGVDVSSGVETGESKDPEKIVAFASAANAAFARL